MRIFPLVAILGLTASVRRKRTTDTHTDPANEDNVEPLAEERSRECPPRTRSWEDAAFRLGSAGFRGPECETQKWEVPENINQTIKGALALLAKRKELNKYNRPEVPSWNTSALTPREQQFDKEAVSRGFRPPGGSHSYPGKAWMGSYGQKVTSAGPGGTSTRFAPDPKTVSQNLMHPNGNPRACSDTVNQWFVAWIQLQTEDWIRTDQEGARGRNGPNVATGWWDMDSTYGTGYDMVESIRTHKDGKVDPDKVASRDDIGQWVGISALKYALAKEHNYIAEQLVREHPEWEGDDEELFGRARLINAAVTARIHTLHWTKVLLQAKATQLGQTTLWDGLVRALTKLPPSTAKILATIFRPFSDRNTLKGIVGGELQTLYDFAWPEEFGLVYRLHPLLPDSLRINGSEVGLLELATHAKEFGYKSVGSAMSEAQACALTLQNFPKALSNLRLQTGGPPIDLGEHDVIATRKRGLGSFNDFRRSLHLTAYTSFREMVTNGAEPTERDQRIINALEKTYDHVEDVDAVVGIMAEPRMPNCLLGISQYLVFVAFTQTRLESDPFFTEKWDKQHYTSWGLKHIETRTFAGILGDHLDQHFASDHEWAGFMQPGWQP